jgi:hypothetical protein
VICLNSLPFLSILHLILPFIAIIVSRSPALSLSHSKKKKFLSRNTAALGGFRTPSPLAKRPTATRSGALFYYATGTTADTVCTGADDKPLIADKRDKEICGNE